MTKVRKNYGDTYDKHHPPPTFTFEQFAVLWERDLRALASRYCFYFDGEVEDAQQELHIVMYKAWLEWKPGREFGKLYWSMVRNRLTDQVKKRSALKRSFTTTPVAEIDESLLCTMAVDVLLLPNMPEVEGHEHDARLLWDELIRGDKSLSELRNKFGHTTYRQIVASWRRSFEM